MISLFLAYVTATALLMAFKSTRWMGVIAAFIVLTVCPILSSLLLILVAGVCYVVYGAPRWEEIRRRLRWRD